MIWILKRCLSVITQLVLVLNYHHYIFKLKEYKTLQFPENLKQRKKNPQILNFLRNFHGPQLRNRYLLLFFLRNDHIYIFTYWDWVYHTTSSLSVYRTNNINVFLFSWRRFNVHLIFWGQTLKSTIPARSSEATLQLHSPNYPLLSLARFVCFNHFQQELCFFFFFCSLVPSFYVINHNWKKPSE